MKMMKKIPTSIQLSSVLFFFLLYAGTTAIHLNAAVATSAVSHASANPIIPLPEAIALVPDTDLLTIASPSGACVDAHGLDVATLLLATASEEAAPASKEQPQPAPRKPEPPFHGLILQAAHTHNIEPALIKAVIFAESNYNPKAVSKRGARGLMQLMPRTAASLGVADPFDPEDNINGGVKYLRHLLDRFDNDIRLALAAYNAGSRHVRNYNGVPPFPATRLYIKKVFKYKDIYQQEMGVDSKTV